MKQETTTLRTLLLEAVERAGDEGKHIDVRVVDNQAMRSLSTELENTILDISFLNTYGEFDAYSVSAWTEDRIYLTNEYDGRLFISWVSRNVPVLGTPMNGWTRPMTISEGTLG